MFLPFMLVALFSAFRATPASSPESTVSVDVPDGTVIGKKLPSNIAEFMGIPYAEKPLNDYRFSKPRPIQARRTAPLTTTSKPAACMQTPYTYFQNGEFQGEKMWNPDPNNISEDCLYLNIWAPMPLNREQKLDVMIWVYGGGFIAGTSTLDVYNGAILAKTENVIIASMNYRVGPFGFLYFDAQHAPGNLGLWDQQLAIKWIYDNIHHFGGDKNKITLFGESAGAASVSMHLVSRHSQAYFQRAIMQSGSYLAPWATRPADVMRKRSLSLAAEVGCYSQGSRPDYAAILRCMREANGKTAQQIQDKYWLSDNDGFNDFIWVPVLEGDFLVPKQTVHGLVPSDTVVTTRKQVFTGTNKDEAKYFFIYANTEIFNSTDIVRHAVDPNVPERDDYIKTVDQFKQLFNEFFPKAYSKYAIIKDYALREVLEKYPTLANTLNGPTALVYQNTLDEVYGDLHFTCSIDNFEYAKNPSRGKHYNYIFKHRSSVQTWPKWMGVLHGYEINFVFGEPLLTKQELNLRGYNNKEYTDKEKSLSRGMMNKWANFAKTGNPYGETNELRQPGPGTSYVTFPPLDEADVPRRIPQCRLWYNDVPKAHKEISDFCNEITQCSGDQDCIDRKTNVVENICYYVDHNVPPEACNLAWAHNSAAICQLSE